MEEVLQAMPLWPEAASAYAREVDRLVLWFSAVLVLFVAPVILGLVLLPIVYRRGSPADRSRPPRRYLWLEIGWATIPFLSALVFFGWAAELFWERQRPQQGALDIYLLGKQWMWKAQYPDGRQEINRITVPIDAPVRLVMTSQDVIHSFFVPALRITQDVLPDRSTYVNFTADRAGVYRLLCNEFCGTAHATMTGELVVLEPAAYQDWLSRAAADRSLAEEGERLFRRYGCSGCHAERSAVHAPVLAGVFGSPVPLAGGGFIVADEAYIRDSILLPNKHVVAGYEPIMPSFEGRIGEGEIVRLVAYVKSLAQTEQQR